jgi:hypothetical protein
MMMAASCRKPFATSFISTSPLNLFVPQSQKDVVQRPCQRRMRARTGRQSHVHSAYIKRVMTLLEV